MPRRLALAFALLLVLAPVAIGATTLTLKSDKTALKFDKSTLKAKPGLVTIKMSNPAFLEHNVAIRGKGITKGGKTAKKVVGKIVKKGGVSVVTATLASGTYTFYCSVPGHEAGGMKGKLTVK